MVIFIMGDKIWKKTVEKSGLVLWAALRGGGEHVGEHGGGP
jgi:hypothetical protein